MEHQSHMVKLHHWWFGTMIFIFPNQIWGWWSISDELIFFKMVIAPPTRILYKHIWTKMVKLHHQPGYYIYIYIYTYIYTCFSRWLLHHQPGYYINIYEPRWWNCTTNQDIIYTYIYTYIYMFFKMVIAPPTRILYKHIWTKMVKLHHQPGYYIYIYIYTYIHVFQDGYCTTNQDII